MSPIRKKFDVALKLRDVDGARLRDALINEFLGSDGILSNPRNVIIPNGRDGGNVLYKRSCVTLVDINTVFRHVFLIPTFLHPNIITLLGFGHKIKEAFESKFNITSDINCLAVNLRSGKHYVKSVNRRAVGKNTERDLMFVSYENDDCDRIGAFYTADRIIDEINMIISEYKSRIYETNMAKSKYKSRINEADMNDIDIFKKLILSFHKESRFNNIALSDSEITQENWEKCLVGNDALSYAQRAVLQHEKSNDIIEANKPTEITEDFIGRVAKVYCNAFSGDKECLAKILDDITDVEKLLSLQLPSKQKIFRDDNLFRDIVEMNKKFASLVKNYS